MSSLPCASRQCRPLAAAPPAWASEARAPVAIKPRAKPLQVGQHSAIDASSTGPLGREATVGRALAALRQALPENH